MRIASGRKTKPKVNMNLAISYGPDEAVNLLRRLVAIDDVADTFLRPSVTKPIYDAIERGTGMDRTFAGNMRNVVSLEILDTFLRKLHNELLDFVEKNKHLDKQQLYQTRRRPQPHHKKRRKQRSLDSTMICETVDCIMKMDLSKCYEQFPSLVSVLLEMRCHAVIFTLLNTPSNGVVEVYRKHVDITREIELFDEHHELKTHAINIFKLIAKSIQANAHRNATKDALRFVFEHPLRRLLSRSVKFMLALRDQLGPIPKCGISNAHAQVATFSDEGDEFESGHAGRSQGDITPDFSDDDVLEVPNHGIDDESDERDERYRRSKRIEYHNRNGSDMDIDANDVENENNDAPRYVLDYDDDNHDDVHHNDNPNDEESDVSSASPSRTVLRSLVRKLIPCVDDRAFPPKSKSSRRKKRDPPEDSNNISNEEPPNSDQYDGDEDNEVSDKDNGGNDNDYGTPGEATVDPNINGDEGDGDDDESENDDDEGGGDEEDDVEEDADAVEERKNKKRGTKVINDLHVRSQSLNRKFGQDPLPSAIRSAEKIPREHTRRKCSLDRPSSQARDASPIPDSSPITRHVRGSRLELPVSNDDLSDYSHDERLNRQRPEKPEYLNGVPVKRGKFKPHEDEWLVEGLRRYGWGQWALIAQNFAAKDGTTRTGISLKDRARTLSLDPEQYKAPIGRIEKRGRPAGSGARRKGRHQEDEDDPIDNEEEVDDSDLYN